MPIHLSVQKLMSNQFDLGLPQILLTKQVDFVQKLILVQHHCFQKVMATHLCFLQKLMVGFANFINQN
jgi:hypothetical protein